jgi:hypothetical protein
MKSVQKQNEAEDIAWTERVQTAWFKTYQCGLLQIVACPGQGGHAHAGTQDMSRVVLCTAKGSQHGVVLERWR